MKLLLWHVHGSWTNAFVQGDHEYLLPLTPHRGPDGLGRARTWDWPVAAREVPVGELRDQEIDAVVLQRPHEAELVRQWTGRRPGRDLPAVYVEHNTPSQPFAEHPLARQCAIPLVHVTHFNRQIWSSGLAPARVIEHGVPDPGYRYTGEIASAAAVVNDPLRRGRAVGADVIAQASDHVPVDLFGMNVEDMRSSRIRTYEDLPQHRMHAELAQRAVYLHPCRWTSLGLSLIEAMMLGMPVVALDTTEASRAVPPQAGFLSNDLDELSGHLRRLVRDPALAAAMGRNAREVALHRYGLARFLTDWDDLLTQLTASPASAGRG